MQRLAERIGFTLENLDYRFPDFPDGRGNPLSLTEQTTLLRRHAYAGASRRYGVCSDKVKSQLEHELAMIHRLGFSGYFLIVHDLVEFALQLLEASHLAHARTSSTRAAREPVASSMSSRSSSSISRTSSGSGIPTA